MRDFEGRSLFLVQVIVQKRHATRRAEFLNVVVDLLAPDDAAVNDDVVARSSDVRIAKTICVVTAR